MSNYLAVANVSAALKQVVQAAANVVGGAEVKLGRPENKDTSFVGVHVYLYMIRSNPGLSNRDLATRTSDGRLLRRPQQPLDLYYILSFYGDESQLIPQRLMGSTICALEAEPFLSRERILEVTDPNGPYPFLAESNLAEQMESVKFSQIYLSNEDFSKMWSVFLQVPHRLFVTYQASVVILEPQLPVITIPPVKEARPSTHVLKKDEV